MSTATAANPKKNESRPTLNPKSATRKKIWVDLDNSPHVPFFRPIIEELRKRNYQVFITARDAYQVRELTEFYGVEAKIIGRHYGKHKILKALGTCFRAIRLTPLVRRQKPDLAICHGSRALLMTCALLRIPSVMLIDYEFATILPGFKPTWVMAPSVMRQEQLKNWSKIVKYPGIKEDVYLSKFKPDASLRTRLGIDPTHLLIALRPPATEAHYHNPEAETLLVTVLSRFANAENTTTLLLPRNKRQENELRSSWADTIASGKFIIPPHVEDGLNLIWNADLVISGGGTMNREAAAMGVPVYSIFRGKIGDVDQYLAQQSRLILIETPADVAKIEAVRRNRTARFSDNSNSPTLEAVVRSIVSIVETEVNTSR
jgi:uncharacterized protein